MLFKVITVFIIFFVARNFYRSWKLFQQLQNQQGNMSGKGAAKSGPNSPKSKDDVIDAEYTVVDK